MDHTAQNLIRLAGNEVGYLEKKSNAQLDSKTANAGSKNFTKYARDLAAAGYYNGSKQGFAWCNVFVDWLFWQLCGKDKAEAQALSCQSGPLGAACYFSMGYYKAAGRFYSQPQPGDQIFFGTPGNVRHTGIVEDMDGERVYTIEGNTNGGVCQKSYSLTEDTILGYGRPRYEETDPYTREAFVRDVQQATGAAVDGIPGPETISKTVTVSARFHGTHAVIKPIQKRLAALGYSEVGRADGIAGSKFTAALTRFQQDSGCCATGLAEEWGKTWRKLLGML